MGELEIAPLTADFRADQCLGALFSISEVSCGAIPLDQAQMFMEGSAADTGTQLQVVLQSHGGRSVGTDHHHLGRLQAGQGLLQPGDTGIFRQPLFFVHGRFGR